MKTYILLLLAFYFNYFVVQCDQQCLCNASEYIYTQHGPDNNGFSSLLSLTKSFRSSFFSITSTSFERLRNDIHNIYIGSVTFSDIGFINTAVYYCKEAQFLAAFILSVSILFPVVLLFLWYIWIKCYNDDDTAIDEDDELLNKHLSLPAHVITWSLSCCILLLLIPLIAFGVILIVANERVGGAVTMSADAVRETLPLINSLHEEFLTALNNSLIIDYSNVNNSIYNNELNLSRKLAYRINTDNQYNQLLSIIQSATNITDTIEPVYNHINRLISFHYSLESEDLINLITTINSKITSLIEFCNSTMYKPCTNLTTSYYPIISTTLTTSLPNTTSLIILLQMMKELNININTTTVNNRINIYNDFIQEIENNVSIAVNERSNIYLYPINNNVSNSIGQLFGQLQHITYGLPRSQNIVEDALGEAYLSNWQDFRNIFTIAFSLSFLVFSVGVVLAILRGIINTMAIYLYGDELDYILGTHLASMMLKSFIVWVSIVGVVSAFFFVFILCLASIVGRGCGIHGNYSEIIDDVIDNNSTWGGGYPLGTTYYGDSAHPLLLHSIIRSCSANQSSIEALQLMQLLDYNNLLPSSSQEVDYIEDMKNILMLITFTSYSLLGTSLINSFDQYRMISNSDYPWYQYNNLDDDIFGNSFVGIDQLSSLLNDMVTDDSFNNSLTNTQQIVLTNIINNISTLLIILTDEAMSYKEQIVEARSSSTDIQQTLEQVYNVTPNIINNSRDYKMNLINAVDIITQRYTLMIATNITKKIKSIITSSTYFLSCDVSLCRPIAIIVNNFTDATCNQLLDGLDIYWISLLMIFITCLLIILLMVTLMCHLADREVYRRQHNPKIQQQYNQFEQIVSQLISLAWFILATGIDLWFLVAIAIDERYTISCDQEESFCCPICQWVIGTFFLLVSIICISLLRIYQFIIIRRIRASRVGKVQQIQRYWWTLLRAAIFYEGLVLFFIMYIPFVAISGSYITTKTITTPPSFASLVVSFLGILFFLVSMVTERSQIIEHLNLVQQKLSCICKQKDTYNNTTNGDINGNGGVASNGGVAGIQLTAINPIRGRTVSESDHTAEYEDDGTRDVPVLPTRETPHEIIIRETTFDENELQDTPLEHINNVGPSLEPFIESNDINEDPIDEDQIPSILLDQQQQQRTTDNTTIRKGIRLAHLSQHTDIDGSTPRSSLYMSEQESVAGTDLPPYYYRSLSHVPVYTSTDDSSYRDDYDSYDSDHTNNYYPAHIDGKQVEV